MMVLFTFLIAASAAATDMQVWAKNWLTGTAIVDQHQGYTSGDVIQRPAGTWQLLYGVVRVKGPAEDSVKDCVWVKVPTAQDGALKIVSVARTEPCADNWDQAGWVHLQNLRAVQFSIEKNKVKFWITDQSGRVQQFKTELLNLRTRTAPMLFDASAPARIIPGVFLFAPNSSIALPVPKDLTGGIADEYPSAACSFEDGSCERCRWGVYRVRNGKAFDYYCGVDRCGQKNAPACDRGVTWQRLRKNYSCRADQSYAFCAPGLKVECVGEQAVCR